MPRGLVINENPVDVATSRGLSREQVHRRFIRYRDISEANFFAPQPTAAGALFEQAVVVIAAGVSLLTRNTSKNVFVIADPDLIGAPNYLGYPDSTQSYPDLLYPWDVTYGSGLHKQISKRVTAVAPMVTTLRRLISKFVMVIVKNTNYFGYPDSSQAYPDLLYPWDEQSVPVVQRTTKKNLSVVAAAVASLTRLKTFLRTIVVTAVGALTLQRETRKNLVAIATTVVTLSSLKTLLRAINVTAIGVVSLQRSARKNVVVAVSGALTLTRQTAHAILTVAAGVVTVERLKTLLRTITVTAAATASLTRQTGKTLVAAATGAVSVSRQTAKRITVAIAASANLLAVLIGIGTGVAVATRRTIVSMFSSLTGTLGGTGRTRANVGTGETFSPGGSGTTRAAPGDSGETDA